MERPVRCADRGLQGAEGGSLLLNTRLNIMGKPIVHAPDCLRTTGIDALMIDDVLVEG